MKKGKIIGIIVGAIVLVLIIAGIIGYLFINDMTQKAKIIEEFEQIETLTNSEDFTLEELNEKTKNIVSTGKYEAVERAAKKYASDVFGTAFEIKESLQDEKMAQLLAASNYSEDGPEFTETKKYISEKKQKLEDGKAKMLGFVEESKINSYIESETTDAYATELYKQLLAEDLEISETEKKELESSIDKVISMLELEEDVIDFLIENKGNWEVQGEQVMFNSNSLVTEYNALLTKLRIL